MKIIENVIYFLKNKYNLKNDKEVAEFLNINYGTFRNAVSADKVPFSLLIELAKKEDIDLQRLFFGQQKNEELMLVLYEALSVSDEIEVKKILKQHILEKIFSKIFVKKRGFVEKIFSAFEWKTQRIVLFLLEILKQIKNENVEIINNYKDFLLQKINNINLLTLSNILDFTFTGNEKQKLYAIVESLDEDECKTILEDCDQTIEALKNSLDFVKKLIY